MLSRITLPQRRALAFVLAVSFLGAQPAVAAAAPAPVQWKVSSLAPSSKTALSAIAITPSRGRKTWSASGACSITKGVLVTRASGSCTVKLRVKAARPYAARTSQKRLVITPTAPTTTKPTTPSTTRPTTTTTTTTTTTPPSATGCGSSYKFPDLSAAPGAGSSYAKPNVKASCANGYLTMTSNGMIAYAFEPKTPNALTAQSYTWKVTTSPSAAASTTSIRNQLGTLGFTVTGIPIYGPTEGPVPPNQAFGDPVWNNILDSCKGHTGYGGAYHYHAILAVNACYLEETIIGYALDGFPIYSNPNWTQKSGYSRTGNPTSNSWDAYSFQNTGTLDACNGRTGDDGSYRYYVTESFPYIIGCYRGTPAAQTGQAAAPMQMPGVSKASAAPDAVICVIPSLAAARTAL